MSAVGNQDKQNTNVMGAAAYQMPGPTEPEGPQGRNPMRHGRRSLMNRIADLENEATELRRLLGSIPEELSYEADQALTKLACSHRI